MASLKQTAYDIDHLRYVIGRRCDDVRFLDPQLLTVFKEGAGVRLGVSLDVLACLDGSLDDFVIDVRDVHHMFEDPSLAEQVPPQDVFEDIGSQIADMYIVVNGWSARVHSNGGSIQGGEIFQAAGEGVGQFKHFERLIKCRTTA